MNSKKVIAGILAGFAAGAILSHIISSEKIQKSGKKLLKKGNNLSDDLKGKFNEYIDHLQDKVHSILK